jgi:uncharacterized protein (DUF1800 family)
MLKPSGHSQRLEDRMLRPLSKERWNFETAAHLLNRAGFGGTPLQIQGLANLSHDEAVAELLNYDKQQDFFDPPTWAKPDPERAEKLASMRRAPEEERKKLQREMQQNQRQHMVELKGWWLRRMAFGQPFQEKMTLFWHGHFATSMEKVRDAYLMWQQNDLFRRMATGNWPEFLTAVAKDPAMLVYLDQAQSRKDHPNENFARELMELFTLGEGHYTEKDVTEGARALTGWSYDRPNQQFVNRPFVHDRGQKTFLGRTGNLNGDDVIAQIVAQPQAARFIMAKIWKFFAGDDSSPELTDALAAVFRNNNDTFKPALLALFRSEEFYAPEIVRNQVKSPVQWLVGSVKMLERELPPPMICFGLTRNLGQDLFAPPNVKGWDGGLSWITTNNLLSRYNEAAVLALGDMSSIAGSLGNPKNPNVNPQAARRMQNLKGQGADVKKLFTEAERANRDALIPALEKRFLQSKLKPKQEATLREYLGTDGPYEDNTVRNAIRLVMSTPEYQLT